MHISPQELATKLLRWRQSQVGFTTMSCIYEASSRRSSGINCGDLICISQVRTFQLPISFSAGCFSNGLDYFINEARNCSLFKPKNHFRLKSTEFCEHFQVKATRLTCVLCFFAYIRLYGWRSLKLSKTSDH